MTILSSSGLRMPSRGSSERVRGVLRPACDWGATGELSVRGPMSRPAVETHTDIQKQITTCTHIRKHTKQQQPNQQTKGCDHKYRTFIVLIACGTQSNTTIYDYSSLGVPVLFKRSVLGTVKRQTGHTNSQYGNT